MSRRESDDPRRRAARVPPPGDHPPRLPPTLGARARAGWSLGNSLLAACGGGKEGAAGGRRRAAAAGGERARRCAISNWPLYIDKQTVPDFEKATGIKVEYTEDINDNGEFFAKIDEPLKRNQSIDRDIIVLTDWMAGRLIRLGYVAPLDDAKFPNKANLVDNVKDVSFDPGRKYSVPWLSGMTGVGLQPEEDRARSSPASTTSSTPSSRARSRC